MSSSQQHALVSPITQPDDLAQAYFCSSEAFGRQAKDAIWISMNRDWDTPEGQKAGSARLIEQLKHTTKDKDGDPNTVFLGATLPDPQDASKRRVVGMAIWVQVSFIPGWGDPPSTELEGSPEGLDPVMLRFAKQMIASLRMRRVEVAREKATADPPAIFVLDMCAVDPAFQRRGIAGKLVQWGLNEAKRRGGLECTTEASSMGRQVYMRLGLRHEGRGDIEYFVDEEFKDREKPPNVFLRTG